MVTEALSSSTSHTENSSGSGNKTQLLTENRAAVNKNASSNNASQSASRQQRLVSHLIIGFLMAGVAISGYLFLGPHAHASAADFAGNRIVNVASNVPPRTANATVAGSQVQMSDLIAMQAQMAEITNQMNALKAESVPMNMLSNASTGNSYNTTAGYSQAQMATRLDQMMLMIDDMMSKMNGNNMPSNGMNTKVTSGGHGHH